MAQKNQPTAPSFLKTILFFFIFAMDGSIYHLLFRTKPRKPWLTQMWPLSLSLFLVRQMWRWTSSVGEIFEILIRFWVFAGVDELSLSGRWWIVLKCRVITLRTFSWKRGHRPVPTAKARARRSRRFRAHSNAHQWPRDKPARWLLHLFCVCHSGTSR